jgi:16S rRNA U516 pseudouridylate synthase RsuA-like enzyme
MLTDETRVTDEKEVTVKFTLSEHLYEHLNAMANRFGMHVEDLVRINITEMLEAPTTEDDALNEYIVTKNAELYRRLA